MSEPLPTTTRQITLASRPVGEPTPENFALVEVALPDLADDEILVRNTAMSVDPYMRGRMNDVKSYIPPFQLGEPLDGGAVGEVIASRAESLPVGTHVVHGLGWREHAVVGVRHAKPIDPALAPTTAHLGILGMPGLTAYAGLVGVAEMREGDVVFVSGAAGAVGSLAGQLARLMGASRVIGSAGSAEKVERLRTLGFDAAFNYRDRPVRESLREAAPDGIDVYFDNVGGDHLEAAISSMRQRGRIALCGAISAYNETEPVPGPSNLFQAIGKGLTLRGFIVMMYSHLRPEFEQRMAQWLAHDEIVWDETFRDGLESAPTAFIELLAGANTGKMIVRL
ncbi:MAG TPA: NADP-dependent oxidoreductase [Intrasporangiaceae bacterium]|nr:NADP-dependent oxidoreductase [Intrasporangiaceae bacterium]